MSAMRRPSTQGPTAPLLFYLVLPIALALLWATAGLISIRRFNDAFPVIFVLAAVLSLPVLILRDLLRAARRGGWLWRRLNRRRLRRIAAGLCASCGYDLRAS